MGDHTTGKRQAGKVVSTEGLNYRTGDGKYAVRRSLHDSVGAGRKIPNKLSELSAHPPATFGAEKCQLLRTTVRYSRATAEVC